MHTRRVGRALALGSTMVISAALLSASSVPSSPDTEPKPDVVRPTMGGTVEVKDRPGNYERVLLAPPEDDTMSSDAAWVIGPDLAVKLGRLSPKERWAVIRRNLGLAPEDDVRRHDLILWREVADTIFDMIGTLNTTAEGGPPAVGLQVAFPGGDTSEPQPEVALTFNDGAKRGSGFDEELTRKIGEEMTGVEGFLKPAPETPADYDVNLRNAATGETSVTHPDRLGYFCFPHLRVDPEFGGDYHIALWDSSGEESSTADWDEADAIYVPVKHGARTRVDLTVDDQTFRILSGAAWLGVTGHAEMIQEFLGQLPMLEAIVQRLTPNPGLHVGAVAVRGSGAQPILLTRHLLKRPTRDRGPQLVSEGSMRLECLTPATPEGGVPAGVHYLRIVLAGQATEADLDLRSRPTSQTPWGIGIGVVPSADPTLYAVGASYRLTRGVDLLAGVGIQKDNPNSFVYGITLDQDYILNAIFGKPTAEGE